MQFFKDKNPDFLMSIMVELKPLRMSQGDTLYHQKDHAEEIYFIMLGKIKLHVDITPYLTELPEDALPDNFNSDDETLQRKTDPQLIPFIAYTAGSYFGDVDLFQDKRKSQLSAERDSTAVAEQDCNFFVLTKEPFTKMKQVFCAEFAEIQTLALKRRTRHGFLIQSLINKVRAVIEEKRDAVGSIDFMAELGKTQDFYLHEADSTDEENQVKHMIKRKKTFITNYF